MATKSAARITILLDVGEMAEVERRMDALGVDNRSAAVRALVRHALLMPPAEPFRPGRPRGRGVVANVKQSGT